MKKVTTFVPVEFIERKIYLIRGVKVMLDRDLATLYEVKPIALRQQVKRNTARFPSDFMFQLREEEVALLVSQNVIPSRQILGGSLPYAFTEQGVAMLSAVLKSKKAVDMSIVIVRAFIKLRELLSSHKDLIEEIQKIKNNQKSQNQKIESIINVINRLLAPSVSSKTKEQMGFRVKD